jgi:hypothetical protein
MEQPAPVLALIDGVAAVPVAALNDAADVADDDDADVAADDAADDAADVADDGPVLAPAQNLKEVIQINDDDGDGEVVEHPIPRYDLSDPQQPLREPPQINSFIGKTSAGAVPAAVRAADRAPTRKPDPAGDEARAIDQSRRSAGSEGGKATPPETFMKAQALNRETAAAAKPASEVKGGNGLPTLPSLPTMTFKPSSFAGDADSVVRESELDYSDPDRRDETPPTRTWKPVRYALGAVRPARNVKGVATPSNPFARGPIAKDEEAVIHPGVTEHMAGIKKGLM